MPFKHLNEKGTHVDLWYPQMIIYNQRKIALVTAEIT